MLRVDMALAADISEAGSDSAAAVFMISVVNTAGGAGGMVIPGMRVGDTVTEPTIRSGGIRTLPMTTTGNANRISFWPIR